MGDTNFQRTATFVVMFLLAGLHNLSKSLGVALLLAVSGQTTLVVLAGEMIGERAKTSILAFYPAKWLQA